MIRNFGRAVPSLAFLLAPQVLENYRVAINTQGPYHPQGKTRVDAILASNHYTKTQVGFGVNGCIKMIYIGLKTFGEAEIGSVFCSDKVQQMLEKEGTFPNHLAVAKAEVQYWRAIASDPKSWSDYVGAGLATCFNPQSRVMIQKTMEKFRKTLVK